MSRRSRCASVAVPIEHARCLPQFDEHWPCRRKGLARPDLASKIGEAACRVLILLESGDPRASLTEAISAYC
jgi:hypothetical protein